MKRFISYLYIVVALLVLAACNRDGGGHTECAYTVEGTFDVDSTVVLDRLVLYTNEHTELHIDSLDLTSSHSFEHTGQTRSVDELYLCSDGGELCRFYATGHSKVKLKFQMQSDTLGVTFEASPNDTINPWLQAQTERFRGLMTPQRKTALDTLCHEQPSDVRCALLLRDQVATLQDSVFVRRCLGALSDEAKPDWLMRSIDQILVECTKNPRQSRRLTACKVDTDSTTFDFGASRSDYLLIQIWADYSQASVDSLKVLDKLVNEEYDMKRVKLVTICLSAHDSAWWKSKTEGIEGLHAWVPAGLADERMRKWAVKQVPTMIICDMYNNQQLRNEWGDKLRAQMKRLPNRSGFSHTPKPKPKSIRGR
jgi:hypothetical protein